MKRPRLRTNGCRSGARQLPETGVGATGAFMVSTVARRSQSGVILQL
ncbi:hypothetical protein LJC45_00405 [Alistipes sp. OttesenSCG-928-B03]|nr:hypothetical protein [Alistipes sp. OttesenSCG-928-B03]